MYLSGAEPDDLKNKNILFQQNSRKKKLSFLFQKNRKNEVTFDKGTIPFMNNLKELEAQIECQISNLNKFFSKEQFFSIDLILNSLKIIRDIFYECNLNEKDHLFKFLLKISQFEFLLAGLSLNTIIFNEIVNLTLRLCINIFNVSFENILQFEHQNLLSIITFHVFQSEIEIKALALFALGNLLTENEILKKDLIGQQFNEKLLQIFTKYFELLRMQSSSDISEIFCAFIFYIECFQKTKPFDKNNTLNEFVTPFLILFCEFEKEIFEGVDSILSFFNYIVYFDEDEIFLLELAKFHSVFFPNLFKYLRFENSEPQKMALNLIQNISAYKNQNIYRLFLNNNFQSDILFPLNSFEIDVCEKTVQILINFLRDENEFSIKISENIKIFEIITQKIMVVENKIHLLDLVTLFLKQSSTHLIEYCLKNPYLLNDILETFKENQFIDILKTYLEFFEKFKLIEIFLLRTYRIQTLVFTEKIYQSEKIRLKFKEITKTCEHNDTKLRIEALINFCFF